MQAEKQVAAFWQAFLQKAGLPASTQYYECFAFSGGGEVADELLALVLEGKKRATCSALPAYQGEPLPQVGSYSIITDGSGRPCGVIQTTAVAVLPFRQMTFAMCSREGEDNYLSSWQANHRKVFKQESKEVGYHFDAWMPVVFEDFELVYTA